MKNTYTKRQIIFYKTCIEKIYKHITEGLGKEMTKAQVDEEVKINAGFPYDSCAHEDCDTDDMGNLIVWMFMYGDEWGIQLDYPSDELDKKIKLNIH